MKPLILCFGISLLLAANVFAGDPGTIIKQKAKDASNQNNASQGVSHPPSSQPGSPPATTPPPAPPPPPTVSITPAMQQSITKLQSDFEAIKGSAEPTADQKQQLMKDLLAGTQGDKRPSQSSIIRLGNDLSAALAGKNISTAQLARLARDIQIAVNAPGISRAMKQAFADDAQAILKAAGAPPSDTTAVANDLKAIAAEVAK